MFFITRAAVFAAVVPRSEEAKETVDIFGSIGYIEEDPIPALIGTLLVLEAFKPKLTLSTAQK